MENKALVDGNAGVYSIVKSIEEDGIEDVYCLNVPEHGNFIVNEGIVVKNCLDALRYALYTHFLGQSGEAMSPQDLEKRWRQARGENDDLPPQFRNPSGGYRF